MSQDSVLKVLKKEKKLMTPKEIAKKLNISAGNVTVALNKLFKQGDIIKIPIEKRNNPLNRGGEQFKWGIK